jgi:hypothetical protein
MQLSIFWPKILNSSPSPIFGQPYFFPVVVAKNVVALSQIQGKQGEMISEKGFGATPWKILVFLMQEG